MGREKPDLCQNLLLVGGGGLGGWLVQALEAGSFGDIPKKEGCASKNHNNEQGEKKEEEVLHRGKASELRRDAKQKTPAWKFAAGVLKKESVCLGPSKVGAVFGTHFDDISLFYEERDLHSDAGFEDGGLGGVVGGVAFEAFGGIGDRQLDVVGKVD